MYPVPESTPMPTMPKDTITHQYKQEEDKPLKSLLEANNTLKFTLQSNKPLMSNLYQLTKLTNSQRKFKQSLLNQSENKPDTNKELSQLELSSRRITPAVSPLQSLREERRPRREDVLHVSGFCWVF